MQWSRDRNAGFSTADESRLYRDFVSLLSRSERLRAGGPPSFLGVPARAGDLKELRAGLEAMGRGDLIEAEALLTPAVELGERSETVDLALPPMWGLAEVAFVGGSLDGRRGGQNMIEPAAFGVAVTFGPHVWNFRDVAENLVAAGGAVRVADAAGLETAVLALLADADRRGQMGTAARRYVRSQQGATSRTMAAIDEVLRRRENAAALAA